MKKPNTLILLISIIFILSLSACGQTQAAEAASSPVNTVDTEAVSLKQASAAANTYWVAYEWEIGEGYEADTEKTLSLPTADWMVDLILQPDGTARLRDIGNGIYLEYENGLYLFWEQNGDQLNLLDGDTKEVLWQGKIEGDTLTLDYFAGTLRLKQAAMPSEAGELYSPAELVGTWLMVTDDSYDEPSPVLPGHFETLVFRTAWTAESAYLVADMEQKDYFGYMVDSFYDVPIELIDVPLYDGCGNEKWSVRIHPTDGIDRRYSDNSVTLLDQNTLLMQKYSEWDDSFTNYTYHRILPQTSGWEITAQELEGCFFRCAEYTDADGNILPMPNNLKDFYLFLTADGKCWFGVQKEGQEMIELDGEWHFGKGGALMAYTTEYHEDFIEPCWYGGAVRGFYNYTTDSYNENYELFLYDNGGIIRMSLDAAG